MHPSAYQLNEELDERHWWFVGRRNIVTTLLHHLIPPSHSVRVLDIGCGTGATTAALSQEYHCIGMDSSEDALRRARSRYPSTTFLHLDTPVHAREVIGRSEVVLLLDVLEHVKDDASFLSAIITSMTEGAYLLITVPAHPSLWSEHDVLSGHERRYERSSLQHLWNDLPVSLLLFSYFNTYLYPIIRIVRMLSQLRRRTSSPHRTDLWLPPSPLNVLLEKIFATEAMRLRRILMNGGGSPYAYGASLIAILRRT
jgi:SAM-dependent methyltransferase